MAMVVSTLAAQLKAINALAASGNGLTADEWADKTTAAIDAYIKTATVTVAPGIAVATTGSPAAQTGATTASGTGTIA